VEAVALTPALSQGEREHIQTIEIDLPPGEAQLKLPLPLGEGWGEGVCLTAPT